MMLSQKSPFLSIILPVYNAEAYLRCCLESVLSQSLQEIEIICLNDASTDNSLHILEEYAQKDNRMTVVDKRNEGAAATRNRGILMARGEFVAFMDADDFYPTSDILEILYRSAKETNVLICGGEFARYRDEKLEPITDEKLAGYLFDTSSIVTYQDYQFDYGFHRFIYNREFLIGNKIFYPHYKRYEDPPFFVMAMIKAGQFYAVDKVSYGYRVGHHEVRWTKESVRHNLKAIRDVILLAQKHGLKCLEDLQVARLKMEYFIHFEQRLGLRAYLEILRLSRLNAELRAFFHDWFFHGKSPYPYPYPIHTITALTSEEIRSRRDRYPTYRRRYHYCKMMAKLCLGQRKRHYEAKSRALRAALEQTAALS